MLTDLCQELRNWFDRGQPKWFGDFEILGGELVLKDDMSLKQGQFFRIVGSALNDGVYQYGDGSVALTDESFTGAVWAMAVPPAVIALSAEIDAWLDKNADAIASPYASESFGGYSYSRATGGSASAGGSAELSWVGAFASRLNRWRKI